ncbi:unnamed protein product [Cylindrotheca closterium]|uniref:Uncharacterized protein n=1 Tax=Cylindrotheca closterium TaxID=2856 RepID=A0AAD2JM20_9STRA|nr:unnamed protein product [Cylindrotheca closterium]
MGNNNSRTTNAIQSNRVVRPGLFHDLEKLAHATDFLMKRSCSSAMDTPMLANSNDFVLKRSCSSAMDAPMLDIAKRSCSSVTDAPPSKRLRRSKRRRKVHFNESVRVCFIQHHSSYSKEEHRAMWRSSFEIGLHAKRNSVERYYEGKNWRNAPEESDMLFDILLGIRYHPCWTTPRKPYHGGVMLYGHNYKLASHNHRFFHHVRTCGMLAFFEY